VDAALSTTSVLIPAGATQVTVTLNLAANLRVEAARKTCPSTFSPPMADYLLLGTASAPAPSPND